jgi:two-component system C4-dicarboxylate transport sensor histidine kinase DctB
LPACRRATPGGHILTDSRRTKRSGLILLGICLLGAIPLAILGMRAATGLYLGEAHMRAEATLALTLQALDGQLRRYEAVPELLADNAGMHTLLADDADPAGRMAMNRWLHQKNAQLDSSDIYLMRPDGLTIAASNHARPDSFVGQNFSYRPYFTAAVEGGRGRFYAIGTTSGVRGFYFAAPVRDTAGRVAGVIAVKIGLDSLEAEWRAQAAQIFVTDPEGIVFLSTDPGWLYKGLLPLTPERLARTARSRRYADVVPEPLPHRTADVAGTPLITLATEGVEREYILAGRMMPRAGWTVHVLLDTAPIHAQARLAMATVLLLIGVGGAIVIMLRQRRMRLAERIAMQEQAKQELERRVEARTADLARVNVLIEAEVAERRLTEAALRRTQGDLVQAGKLAALGQMSAALSHEINQPLAAARNYADSAAILIDRGEPVRAKDNIAQIMSLIDRMATIARHLRNVARKPDAPLKDVALPEAVAEALALVGPRLAGAEVSVDLPQGLPMVRAGPVRMQQVLANLLSNAADAVDGSDDRRIEISAVQSGARVLLSVRDHGPGVPAAIADRIFDPFFTTKRVGSGLGLGLSISYNIMKDFGGDLRVAAAAGGGAIFTVDLAVAHPVAEAAE